MRQPAADIRIFQQFVRAIQIQSVRGTGVIGFQTVFIYIAPVHFRQFQPRFPHLRLTDVHDVQFPAAEHFNRLVFHVHKHMFHLVRIAGMAVILPVLRPPIFHAGQGNAFSYPDFSGNNHVATRIWRDFPLVAFQKQSVEIMVKTGMGRMKIRTGHVRQQRPAGRQRKGNDGIPVYRNLIIHGTEQGSPERIPGKTGRTEANVQQKILRFHDASVRIGRFRIQMIKNSFSVCGQGPAVRQARNGTEGFRMKPHEGKPHVVNGGVIEKIFTSRPESTQSSGKRSIDPQPDSSTLDGARITHIRLFHSGLPFQSVRNVFQRKKADMVFQ